MRTNVSANQTRIHGRGEVHKALAPNLGVGTTRLVGYKEGMPAELQKVPVRVREVTERISERSRSGRADYLAAHGRGGGGLRRGGCRDTNLAHGLSASDATD